MLVERVYLLRRKISQVTAVANCKSGIKVCIPELAARRAPVSSFGIPELARCVCGDDGAFKYEASTAIVTRHLEALRSIWAEYCLILREASYVFIGVGIELIATKFRTFHVLGRELVSGAACPVCAVEHVRDRVAPNRSGPGR